MTEEGKKTMRHHVIAVLRDFLVVSAFFGATTTGLSILLKPYWEPFATLPQQLISMQQEMVDTNLELAELRATLTELTEPQIVEFQGIGVVTGDKVVKAGGSISVLYSLRRNASCDTEVRRILYDVDRNVSVQVGTSWAIKAPVTTAFIPFTVTNIEIPLTLRPGRYVYYPELTPVSCRPYGTIRVPMSEVFEVIQ